MAQFDSMKLFALWLLTHEMADEEVKAAIKRGKDAEKSGADIDLYDALAAAIDEEKEKLKASLLSPTSNEAEDVSTNIQNLSYELREIQARLDVLESKIDQLLRKQNS